MNIILAEQHEIQGTILTLEDHRAKHIVKVLRAEKGDILTCGILNGFKGTGEVLSIRKKFPFQVILDVQLTEKVTACHFIDLLLALPRPIMLRRILSQATSLGVGRIFVINANRVEKSFWETGLIHPEAYREHLIHGLEQAVDTILPKVEFHKRFKVFIEDYFPGIAKEYSTLLLAHPYSEESLTRLLRPEGERVLLAVGPEGGWVDYELDKFRGAGFENFTLGKRILKVDTAVVSLHGRISAVREALYHAKRSPSHP